MENVTDELDTGEICTFFFFVGFPHFENQLFIIRLMELNRRFPLVLSQGKRVCVANYKSTIFLFFIYLTHRLCALSASYRLFVWWANFVSEDLFLAHYMLMVLIADTA